MKQVVKRKCCNWEKQPKIITSYVFIARVLRPVFILIILLQYFHVDGQNGNTNALWVGQHNNYIRIDTDAIRVNYSWNYDGNKYFHAEAHSFTFSNDTLYIINQGPRNETYKYLVREFSNDKLVLNALNHNFRTLSWEDSVGRTLQFMPQEKIMTDTIQFEKLVFSTTNCYGSCPAMTFQIDNMGLLKFKGGKYAIKQGFYQAILSMEILGELHFILGLSELDKVENNSRFNIDAPTHTLDIYYNGKIKHIKTAFVPFVLDKLLNFLMGLPKRMEFKSMDEFQFKFSQ